MKELKKTIATAASQAGEGHIPSALSILDILWVLYEKILNIDPKDPENPNRDRFILSKGHASLGLYAILAHKGFFDVKEFETFGKYNSILGGHPDRNKVPGVEASTGSLGHGFPMAIGVALALKIKRSSARVYTLIGDGECNEGTIWEAALLAAHHELGNLTCIVDHNRSTDRALDMGNLVNKFTSFGWDTEEVDGHNQDQIFEALKRESAGKPKMIVAHTIKGKGIKSMENNPGWHHKSPTAEELEVILQELS